MKITFEYVKSILLLIIRIIRRIILTTIRWTYLTIWFFIILYMVFWICAETVYSPIYSFENFTTEKWLKREWVDINKDCKLYECRDRCMIYKDLRKNKLKVGMLFEEIIHILGAEQLYCEYENGIKVYSYRIGSCVWKPHFGGPGYYGNVLYLFFDTDGKLIKIRDNINAFFFFRRDYNKLEYGDCRYPSGNIAKNL